MAIDPHLLEDQYIDDLIEIVNSQFSFNKSCTLLQLGGGNWKFGKIMAAKTDAKHFVYADDDREELEKADETDMLTTFCDMADMEQLSNVGKYDGFIIKEAYEKLAPKIESLEEFFVALYKICKLRGQGVIVSRIRPTLPLPEKVLQKWTETVADFDTLKKEGEEMGFKMTQQTFTANVKFEKSNWIQELKRRKLPFMEDVTDEEIEKTFANESATIRCKDELQIIGLKKINRVLLTEDPTAAIICTAPKVYKEREE